MRQLWKSPICSIIIFLIIFSALAFCKDVRAEPNYRWILIDVYWNLSGGQVCKFRRMGGREIRFIVRKRGYGCPNKSINPYNEP